MGELKIDKNSMLCCSKEVIMLKVEICYDYSFEGTPNSFEKLRKLLDDL